MDIQEARQKLTELADGRFRVVRQEITDFHNGSSREAYQLYVDPYIRCIGDSFEKCFEQMEKRLKGGKG